MGAAENDPIFAVITEHKAAIDACVDSADDGDEATTKAFDRQEEMYDRLFMVAPTTVAGVAAWLTHLAELEHPGGRSIVASIGEYYDTNFHATVVQQFLNAAAVLRTKQPAA
jgi:hypothetical protein